MSNVIRIPSPQHHPRTRPVDLLVIHAMGEWVIDDGVYSHATDFLVRIGLSVHALCLPDGRIIESVDGDQVAYHAGEHNERSIGIELLVAGAHDLASLQRAMLDVEQPPYTAAQYVAAGRWLRRQAEARGLGFEHVTTHAHLDPERKQDPGPACDLEALRAAFAAPESR